MESYQILGIIGSALLLVPIVLFTTTPMMTYYPMPHMGYMMGWYYFPYFIGFPAVILGLIGSLINDKLIGGVLLIIASILSLPIFFGFFGISFALLLASGIMAITKR
jgi:hypothetical protein